MSGTEALARPGRAPERDAGSATVEFVAVALPFFLIVLFVVEVTLAFFWWKSAEKATMLGARLAVVQDVAAAGVPALNEKSANAAAVYGKSCLNLNGTASIHCQLALGTN